MTEPRLLRVFLCHSKNDIKIVRELYEKLRAEPWIDPWLDEENLYPGQDWDLEIEKAVEATDAVIVFLSKNAVNKEGYIQAELRYALDIARTKPEETIFIIPFKIEDCQLPRRLKIYQYVDYFPESQRERALLRLLISLKMRSDSLALKNETSEIAMEMPNDGNENQVDGLIEQAISIVESSQRAYPGLLQRRLKIGQVHAERLLNQLESMGIVGPSQGGGKERAVYMGKDELMPEEKTDEDRQVANAVQALVETTLGPFDINPNIETSKPILSGHPTPEWIVTNKIILSNGMEFMRIPAGEFLMGHAFPLDINADLDKKHPHLVNIPYDYWIARYPVTNELYAAYAIDRKVKHPVYSWEKKKDHPVTNIKWAMAEEYCQWLNNLFVSEMPLGLIVRLPTEVEWEKAARGVDGREFPWGDKFDNSKCNSRKDSSVGTTPVSSFSPQGDSPYGCADMAGNILEWTHGLYYQRYKTKDDGNDDFGDNGEDIITFKDSARRGLDFFGNPSCDSSPNPLFLFGLLDYKSGFRIVLAPKLHKKIPPLITSEGKWTFTPKT